jgi:HEAT repeat protein
MHSRKKRKTAGELVKELEADPAYREMRDRKDQLQRELLERIRVAEAPLVEDLHAIGVKASSVWDLVNTHATYAVAIPVLLEHLQRDYIPEVREGIARALAVPEASWAWQILFTFFTREPAGQRRDVKWALACALSGAATDDVIDQIVALVQDPSVGENRLALLSALARSQMPHVRRALEELRQDPQLKREIRILLGSPKRKT